MNKFKFTKIWISETDYKVLRTGGGKPARYLEPDNKQVPKKCDIEVKYIAPLPTETEIISDTF